MRIRLILAVAAAAVAVLGFAACGGSGNDSASDETQTTVEPRSTIGEPVPWTSPPTTEAPASTIPPATVPPSTARGSWSEADEDLFLSTGASFCALTVMERHFDSGRHADANAQLNTPAWQAAVADVQRTCS